jgi:hypothetical protein
MRTTWRLAGAVLCVACGSASPSPSATPSATPTPTPSATPTATPTPTPPAAATATAPYELHEWGVVDVPERGPVEISAGAGQPQRPISVRKPVVYVHVLDGLAETTFGLRVTLGAGAFVEHFPAATVSGATLEWPHVVAHAAHCGDASARESTRRGPTRMACATPDLICEVEELPRYDSPSSACLDVDGTEAGLLFYRGQAPSLALPIATTRAADLTATATASASLAGAPGGLLRLSTALSGPWPPGRMVIARAPFPSDGESVSIPVGTEVVTRAQGIAELRTSLLALGLDEGEANAFMAGWAEELFGPDVGEARDLPSRGVTMGGSGPRHQDVLLYFLPASAIDAIATLTPTPAPRAIHRAFLVRIDLGAVSTG